jgi:hypothetical protein
MIPLMKGTDVLSRSAPHRVIFGPPSGVGKGAFLSSTVSDDVQEPLDGRHVIGIGRGNALPLVVVGVSCGQIEHGEQPRLAVAAMVTQRLAGRLAGDEDATAGVAAVFEAVGFAPAQAGHEVRARVLGLNAVAEPVRTGR